jgi:hypothetical protein
VCKRNGRTGNKEVASRLVEAAKGVWEADGWRTDA